MKLALAALRFVAVSALAFAACHAWPRLVLEAPARLAWLLAPVLGLSPLGPPVIQGAAIAFVHAGTPIVLEDPYVLAGVPLYLGLWAAPARARLPWWRVVCGLAVLELVAGIVLAVVALCIARGYTESPAREPIELVALVLVAAIRVLPLPVWMMLDPAWRPAARPLENHR
jgi:hypothetical protein